MKLNLLFFIMDMLTLLVYPIVFLHGKLHRPTNLMRPSVVTVPVEADR